MLKPALLYKDDLLKSFTNCCESSFMRQVPGVFSTSNVRADGAKRNEIFYE